MKLAALCGTIVLAGTIAAGQQPPAAASAGARGPATPGLTLTTTAFADGAEIPQKYTQSVPNPVSPKLEWTKVPPNTVTR